MRDRYVLQIPIQTGPCGIEGPYAKTAHSVRRQATFYRPPTAILLHFLGVSGGNLKRIEFVLTMNEFAAFLSENF